MCTYIRIFIGCILRNVSQCQPRDFSWVCVVYNLIWLCNHVKVVLAVCVCMYVCVHACVRACVCMYCMGFALQTFYRQLKMVMLQEKCKLLFPLAPVQPQACY